MSAVETKRGILVFTDVSLHAMQFLGPPYTFGVTQVSENITIMGPNVVKAADDAVYWMGQRDFYVYTGQVQKLPCSVKSYVFNDFNLGQTQKFFAALNSSYDEIIWFYCSSDSEEIDRYVTFNYAQNVWTIGTLTRTAWVDRGISNYPVAAGTDNFLYYHEIGLDDGSTTPSSGISSYIESSQMSIGEGERFVSVSHVIPDITFSGSSSSDPNAVFTLKSRNYPGGAYLQSEDGTITQTAAESSTVVEQFTPEYNVRLRGRSFALRVSSTATKTQWRLGTPRVEIRPDGRR